MYLTGTEAVLVGALAGSVVTALAAAFAQRAARASDQLTRIWEREMGIYESALVDIGSWTDLRAEGARHFGLRALSDDDLICPPETDVDELERRRLLVQLEMFGRPEVKAAYEEAGEANKRWLVAYATLRSMYRQNQQANDGLRPPQSAYDRAEIEPHRLAVTKAKAEADARDAQLLEIIQAVARELPKRRRRDQPRAARLFAGYGLGRLRRGSLQRSRQPQVAERTPAPLRGPT